MQASLTVMDAYARRSSKKFEPTAATIALVQTDLDALAVDFEAVSNAAVVKDTVSEERIIGNTPGAGANLDAGATLHCRLDNGSLYPLKIPAVSASLINPDGSVKIDDALVVAYVAHFQAGGEFTVSEGNLITAIEYGELDR